MAPPARTLRSAVPGLVAGLLAAVVLCVVSWRAEHRVAGAWGLPIDDAWIHCQIARNVAGGHGWSFNTGVPVQNSSGPLWTALVAGGFVVFGPSVWVPKILGALCWLGCVTLTWALAWKWSGGSRLAAFVAGMATATSAPLLWHALSGMETVLAASLVAATFAARSFWTSGRRRWSWVVLASAAAMTRPEALVSIPIFLADDWWRVRRRQREAEEPSFGRRLAVTLGIATALLVPYFLFNLRLSGSILPTTFAAKVGATGFLNGLRHGDGLEMLLSATLYPYLWGVHLVAVLGIGNLGLFVAAAAGAWMLARSPHATLAPVLFVVGLPLLRGMMAPHALPWHQNGRYVCVVLPIVYACAALGIAALLGRAPRLTPTAARPARRLALVLGGVVLLWVWLELRVPHTGTSVVQALPVLWRGGRMAGYDATLTSERLGLLLVLVAGAGILLAAAGGPRARRGFGLALAAVAILIAANRVPRVPGAYARNVRDIHDMDVRIGRWVKVNLPAGTAIAVHDIGAIAFFGERPVIDVVGLATPELTPYASPLGLRKLGRLRELAPEFCIIFPVSFPEWVSRPSLMEPVRRWTVPDNTVLLSGEVVQYRCRWDRFARYYDGALLERLDPPDRDLSFRGHVRRGLRGLMAPSRALLHVRAGDFDLLQKRDPGAAERRFRRAIELDPLEWGAWVGLTQALVARQDRDGVARILEDLAQRGRRTPASLELRGDCAGWLGRANEAAAWYDAALELHPDNIRLLEKRERVAARMGRLEEAARFAARRAALEPGGEARAPASDSSP